MMDRLTKIIRPPWMFEAPPEMRREFSLDDPWLVETLWDTARLGLVPDPQMRGLYISGVDERRWQAVIDLIRDSYSEQELRRSWTDKPTDLSGFTYQKALEAARAEDGYHVNFDVQGIGLCLHFNDWDVVNPTIDERAIHEGNFGVLVELMIKFSQATSQVCFLTEWGSDPTDVNSGVIQAIDAHRRVAIVPVPPFVSETVNPPG